MSVYQMTVDEMSVYQMTVDEKSFSFDCRWDVCSPNDCR
jgi:hypothetical protein